MEESALYASWLNSTSKAQLHWTPPGGVERPYTGISSSSSNKFLFKKFITTVVPKGCSLEN